MKLLAAVLLGCCAASALAQQRPQLSTEQARRYARSEVLAAAGSIAAPVRDNWDPLADRTITGDSIPPLHYRVEPAKADGLSVFATVQSAVQRAHDDVLAGRQMAPRVVIGIAPGEYHELVHLPPLPTPLTLWGLGTRPADVVIHANAYSRMTGAELAKAYALPPDSPYVECARRPEIGTGCTPVMWVRNAGAQLRGLTVDNRYDESLNGNMHQAVALATEADRVHLEQVRLLGHQDTLYLKTGAPDRINRVFVHRSFVEGDVDFIFGGATTYFLKSEIRWLGARRTPAGYITAPSTNLHAPYGFVFDDCDFTSDGLGIAAAGEVRLGRQWFAGARCSPYGELAARCQVDATPTDTVMRLDRRTLEAVGKVVVMRSRLGPHLRASEPWAAWNTNRAGPAYRLVQYTSDDFWQLLQAAGHDPLAMGYRKPSPPDTFLAEHCNHGPGRAAAAADRPGECPR